MMLNFIPGRFVMTGLTRPSPTTDFFYISRVNRFLRTYSEDSHSYVYIPPYRSLKVSLVFGAQLRWKTDT